NAFLMQFIADLLKTPITNMGITDVSAWGAALISGLGVKLWNDLEDLPKLPSDMLKRYTPNLNNKQVHDSYLGWQTILNDKRH
nr:hypothetical protein [Mariniflexile sp.]